MRGAFTEVSADTYLLAQPLVEELRHPVGHLWKAVEVSTEERKTWALFQASQLLSHHKHPPLGASHKLCLQSNSCHLCNTTV